MEKKSLEQIYKSMLLLRRFEEALTQYYLDHKVFSFVHFYTGSEASAVGVCSQLTDGDKVFGNHRSHGHYLAKGGCPKKLAAEMLGKATGCAKGFGGSMHPVAKDKGFLGTSPILGSSVPLGVGASFKEKLQKTGNIVVSFTGDGASEEGLSLEAVNLAATWSLPHITVIENNNWSVLTPLNKRRGKYRDNKQVYEGLGAVYIGADGTDVLDVLDKFEIACDYAKAFCPVVFEVFTHRFLAHSTPLSDHKLGLRQSDTKEKMEEEDCLKKIISRVNPRFIDILNADVEKEVAEAVEFAQNSPMPDKNELMKYIYA